MEKKMKMAFESRYGEAKCSEVVKKTDGHSYTDSETVSSSSDTNGPSQVLYIEGDGIILYIEGDGIIELYEDLTIKAGNRLYDQAVDRLRRHEELRKTRSEMKHELDLPTKSPIGQKLRSVVSKKNHEQLKNWQPKKKTEPVIERKTLDLEVLKSAPVPERCNQLYLLSVDEQVLGKQRRSLIEERKARRKITPERKVLPASRAGDMYSRSMERLIAQKVKLAEKAEEVRANAPHLYH